MAVYIFSFLLLQKGERKRRKTNLESSLENLCRIIFHQEYKNPRVPLLTAPLSIFFRIGSSLIASKIGIHAQSRHIFSIFSGRVYLWMTVLCRKKIIDSYMRIASISVFRHAPVKTKPNEKKEYQKGVPQKRINSRC